MGGLCSNDGAKFSMRALVHHPDFDDGDTRSSALRRLPLAGEAGKGSDSEAPSPDGCTHDSKGSYGHPEHSILAKGKTGEQKGKTQRKGRNYRKSQKKKKMHHRW